MKKVYISLALLASTLSISANNFSMPSWGNNNSNGSNWSMPSMNWNNGNGYNNGSNGFNNGTSWNMPSMNFGNGFGNGNGSNWNMPNMNWGNGNNSGSNWSMPNFNWNNNSQPFNFGNNNGYTRMPSTNFYQPRTQANNQYRAPVAPRPPQFIPRVPTPTPQQRPLLQPQKKIPNTRIAAPSKQPKVQVIPQQVVPQTKMKTPAHIPMPSEVKGIILAPENQPK